MYGYRVLMLTIRGETELYRSRDLQDACLASLDMNRSIRVCVVEEPDGNRLPIVLQRKVIEESA